MTWFYISFATAQGHRGSTVVQALDSVGALAEATRLGLNPGGQAQIIPVPVERSEHPDLVPLRNRLASKAELMALPGFGRGVAQGATVVCEDCNDPAHGH